MGDWCGTSWVTGADDFGVESVVLVGGVFDSADGAIRFHKGVFTLDYVSITSFMLGFVVTGVRIFHPVFEFVFRVRLY